MSSLPPGVTDSMCDGVISHCARCGHESEMHLDDETMTCDHVGCHCDGYLEGEYEPDYDDYRSDLD